MPDELKCGDREQGHDQPERRLAGGGEESGPAGIVGRARGRGRAADCGPDQTADEPPGEQQQHHGHHCRDVLLQP
jgi:hypothetical protein